MGDFRLESSRSQSLFLANAVTLSQHPVMQLVLQDEKRRLRSILFCFALFLVVISLDGQRGHEAGNAQSQRWKVVAHRISGALKTLVHRSDTPPSSWSIKSRRRKRHRHYVADRGSAGLSTLSGAIALRPLGRAPVQRQLPASSVSICGCPSDIGKCVREKHIRRSRACPELSGVAWWLLGEGSGEAWMRLGAGKRRGRRVVSSSGRAYAMCAGKRLSGVLVAMTWMVDGIGCGDDADCGLRGGLVPNAVVPNAVVPNAVVPNAVVPNAVVPNAVVVPRGAVGGRWVVYPPSQWGGFCPAQGDLARDARLASLAAAVGKRSVSRSCGGDAAGDAFGKRAPHPSCAGAADEDAREDAGRVYMVYTAGRGTPVTLGVWRPLRRVMLVEDEADDGGRGACGFAVAWLCNRQAHVWPEKMSCRRRAKTLLRITSCIYWCWRTRWRAYTLSDAQALVSRATGVLKAAAQNLAVSAADMGAWALVGMLFPELGARSPSARAAARAQRGHAGNQAAKNDQ
ncbi:hypothetical protein B0H19DRAFT_1075954 [Mycena capillaripes]|nr:hypothetical protein B0H19DRAFT_1075954 [Mycena capillaripes]